uniref:Uncharacterized protein n=1 Tax=Oryza meridionalis TaxID=40149 RepID=A0A0E0CNP8_9ORYZ
MARSTRSAATEQAYSRFAPTAASSRGRGVGGGNGFDEFDESDIWGSFEPAAEVAESPRAARHQVPAARPPGRKAAAASSKPAAHGSLPVNIPDWSKILGDEYRGHHAGDWEADDVDDEDIDAASAVAVLPPHELAWRRRAASLSVHEDGMGIGRTLKVRDAVWKKTGFQA